MRKNRSHLIQVADSCHRSLFTDKTQPIIPDCFYFGLGNRGQ